MKLKRRGIALMLAGAACAVPASASAVDGSLYPIAPGVPQVTPPWSATPTDTPGVWRVEVPAAAVVDGTKVRFPFACPAEGSEIETITYERLRSAAPSSFGADVLAAGLRVSRDPDVNWPQAQGTTRRIPIGDGVCSASLDLVQSETRNQHKRTWFVGGVAGFARDTAPPQVTITSLPAVVGPGAEAVSLRYTVSDNFGADGVGEHRIELDNTVVARRSGVGDFAVAVPVEELRERDHTLRVVVDGDGTAAGSAARQFGVDRTGPDLIITTTRSGAKRVRVNVRGATDLRGWTVHASTYISGQRIGAATATAGIQSLPGIASGTGAQSANLDLSGVRRGELVRLFVLARDASGNLTSHRGPFLYTGRLQKPRITTNSKDIVATFRQRRRGLGNRVETGVGGRVAIGGLLRLRPSGEPLPLTRLSVRDPAGREVDRVRTNERGKYVVRFRPAVSGTYRVFMEGESSPVRALRVFVRPKVGVSLLPSSRLRISSSNRDLILPGTLKAGRESGDVRVRLQQRVGKRWRTVATDFTNASGRFRLIYRPPRGNADRTLRMRVRVSADTGRAFSATATRAFLVNVSKD